MATLTAPIVGSNTFAKCAPNIKTNIRKCGTVTMCSAQPVTQDELNSLFMKGNDYRVMEALFHTDFEIAMCEAKQNGLYQFFMANKVAVNKNLQTRRLSSGLIEIAPFVMARQFNPINNEFWAVSGGIASGSNWQVTVTSTTNIPADTNSFPAGMRVIIHSAGSGGSAAVTVWSVFSSALSGNNVTLVLTPQNAGSYLASAKLTNPSSGLLRRGTPNVHPKEKHCIEPPTYLNWKNVPFWVENTRYTMCTSTLYRKWQKLISSDNPLYREFGDLDEIQKNKQLGADWQMRLTNMMFWGKPISPYQTADAYDLLDPINAYAGILDAGGNQILGAEGGHCVGKRANMVGIYEQLAQCNRVADLQGGTLSMLTLFVELYNMMRVRKNAQHPNPMEFDIFTDSVTAEAINQSMIAYYKAKSNQTMVFNLDGAGYNVAKKADFGFYYKQFNLFWPQGVKINIITHEFFDDYLSAATTAGIGNTARVLWILDFTGIYPGILASKRKTYTTGDGATLAQINKDFACVMETEEVEQTLMGVTLTMIVECPASNLIIENFNSTVPDSTTAPATTYPGTATSTTTSTGTPWSG